MDDARDITWWQIPAGIPARRLRLARRLVDGAILGLTLALASIFIPSAAEALAVLIAGVALLRTSDKRAGRHRRTRARVHLPRHRRSGHRPLVTDPAYASALKESPVDASVDLANQDRPIEEHPFEP